MQTRNDRYRFQQRSDLAAPSLPVKFAVEGAAKVTLRDSLPYRQRTSAMLATSSPRRIGPVQLGCDAGRRSSSGSVFRLWNKTKNLLGHKLMLAAIFLANKPHSFHFQNKTVPTG
jgi:hypothetical protein